jgi:fluoroacetyl-CoA thioesterase
MEHIHPGITGENATTVTPALTATHLGSGGIEVFSTPSMVVLMERAAVAAIDHLLPEGQASVGTALDIRHLAATPVGHAVRAQAEVTAVDGRKVSFTVRAWDEDELIGEGTHTRFVIDVARFWERVQSKAKPATGA